MYFRISKIWLFDLILLFNMLYYFNLFSYIGIWSTTHVSLFFQTTMSLKQIVVKNATTMSLHERWDYYLYCSNSLKIIVFASFIQVPFTVGRTGDAYQYSPGLTIKAAPRNRLKMPSWIGINLAFTIQWLMKIGLISWNSFLEEIDLRIFPKFCFSMTCCANNTNGIILRSEVRMEIT